MSLPGAPTITSITPSNTTLSVAFTAPTSDGGSSITNYQYSTNNGTSWTTPSPAVASSPISISGLTNGTAYTVRLRAVNSTGAGTASASVSGTPATTPSAPTIGSITTSSSGTLSVPFTAPTSTGGSAITNYKYSIDNGVNFITRSPVATTSPILISGLTNGTSYPIKLLAVNAIGEGIASSGVNATPLVVPSAPTITSITTGNTTLSVNFTVPSDNGGSNITNYNYSINNGSTWVTISPAITDASSPISISGLTNGTAYTVRIRAVNGVSPFNGTSSNSVIATPSTTPGAPTIGVITPSDSNLSVAFTAPASTGGNAISNYEYSIDNGANWITRSPVATTSPLVISTGVTNGTQYPIKLRAVNINGSGTASSTVNATPAAVPGSPTDVSANRTASQTISITWTAPTNAGGEGLSLTYKVERSTDNVSWTSVSTTATSPYSNTPLTNGTLYYFRVSAKNSILATYSAVSSVVSATPYTVPNAPTSVSASAQSSTSASISFIAPASNGGDAITSYVVTPYIGAVAQSTTSNGSSPIVVNNLISGNTYTFKVQAVNAAGAGTLSSASGSVYMSIYPKESPTGHTLEYVTGPTTPSVTVINNSTVTYTNTSFSEVEITPTGTSWTITKDGLTDTLIKVRKIKLTDKVIYLLGSGSDAATAITNTPATIGSYTMSRTNTGGNEYLLNYNVNALAEYNASPSRTAVIYFAGDTIYSPSNSGTVLNNFYSPMSIIGKTLNGNKPLLTRPNANNCLLQLWSSNITFENMVIDFYTTVTDTFNAIDIIGSTINFNLIENITFKNIDMIRGGQRGIQLYYVNNILFDNCVFTKAASRATIGISSGKNVTIKNSTIPKSGTSQLNYGSIYINSAYGLRDIYNYIGSGITPQPTINTDRVNWTDEQKLYALQTSNIDLSGNNTFTDDVSTGKALILIDPYRSTNNTIQPNITYTGEAPNVLLPTEFGYAFCINSAAGITIPMSHITKNSTDIAHTIWGYSTLNVTVREVSTNNIIYPEGYALPSVPSNVNITPGNQQLQINWDAMTYGYITSYKLYRNGTLLTTLTGSPPARTYTNTGLVNGTSYSYTVTAVNVAGEGPASEALIVAPYTIPGAPTSVSGSAVSSTSVDVSFTAPASNGGNAISSYTVVPLLSGVEQTGLAATGNASPVTVNGLTTGQIYTFKVKATNAAGSGSLSSASSGVSLLYDTVEDIVSEQSFTYVSGVSALSSKITYTNVAFADVSFNATGSAWTITKNEIIHTLNGVRKVVLSDKVVYLAGSGANSYTSITSNQTEGSYTMSSRNVGGADFIGTYISDSNTNYDSILKSAIVYVAGDTIYDGINNPIDIKSPITISGVIINSNKPLIKRVNNANLRAMKISYSNITIKNIILDLNISSGTEVNAGSVDIGSIIPNLTLLDNINFENVDMVRGYQRGINMNYVQNVTFDGCNLARVSARATIGMTSCKNVIVKNSTIPRSGASLLNYGSIYINTSNGPRDIYNYTGSGITPQPTYNSDRNDWDDTQKLTALKISNINLSENNTFTDNSGLPALILLDTYKSENGTIQYSLTYNGENPDVKLPSDFNYSFNHAAALDTTIPKTFITKNSTDITGSLATWGFSPTNVTVIDVDTNLRIYPDGYELSNTVFDPATITNETEIPLNINDNRVIVPIRAITSLGELADLDPVFITGVSANPKLTIFASSNIGSAVLNANNYNINAICVQRVVKGSTRSTVMDVYKCSSNSSVSVSNTVGGDTQSATATISNELQSSGNSIILSVENETVSNELKSSIYFKMIDGSGNIVLDNFSMPIDIVIPGTSIIPALDLYKYNTTSTQYEKVGVANKKAETNTTFSYTFTTNSDYQLKLARPSAPTNLSITSGDGHLQLDWTAPAEGLYTSYKVYRGETLITTISSPANNLPNSYVDNDVTIGTSYSYTVSAANEAGESDKSESASGIPDGRAFAPANFNATAGYNSASLSWDAADPNVGSIVKYIVYYRNVADEEYTAIDVSSNIITYNLTNLTGKVSYNVKVVPVDQLGEGNTSLIRTVTPYTVPDAPTINSLTEGDASFSVAFTAPESDGGSEITNYKYRLGNGDWVSANTTASPIVINQLSNGTYYSVQIIAVNSAGDGSASSSAFGTPRTVPQAPVINNIAPKDTALSVEFTAPNNGGSLITNYEYKVDNNDWVSANKTSSPILISGLINDQSYSIKLKAINIAGSGSESESKSGTPLSVPNAPVIDSITFGDASLSVVFTAPDNTGKSEIISYEYNLDNAEEWISVESVISPIVINGLENGTLYSVKIRAVNISGGSISSNSMSGTPRTVPPSPTIINILPDDDKLAIEFTIPSNGGSPITNYQYSIDNGSNWVNTNQTSSPLSITDLDIGDTYLFIIRAINAIGNGQLSNKLSSTSVVSSTKYLRNPIILVPSVPIAAGVGSFEMKVEDLKYSARDGISYALNTGRTGTVAMFTIKAFDEYKAPITNFSANPIVVNLTLPNANPANSPLKMYKRINENTFDLLDPQPAGYPANVTYVSGDTWTTTLVSLSSYLIQDPGTGGAAAGGDPHLKQVDGTHLTLPNDWGYIRLYECDDIKVYGKTEFIDNDMISQLHRKDKKNKELIIKLNKDDYRDRYVKKFTYFIELDIYKNDELAIKLDTMNGKIKYNNHQISLDHISKSKSGIYSLTHHTNYEPKNYIEYCIYLQEGDYLKVGIDNFWDDINCFELFLSKNDTKKYKGEFFNHTIENSIFTDNKKRA